MKDDFLIWADGIILVYSMVDKASFDKLREIDDCLICNLADTCGCCSILLNFSLFLLLIFTSFIMALKAFATSV
jgi:hypothetical protein